MALYGDLLEISRQTPRFPIIVSLSLFGSLVYKKIFIDLNTIDVIIVPVDRLIDN